MSKIILYIDSMQCGGAQRVMNVIASHYAEIGYETILVNDIVPIDNILEYSIHPAVRRVFLDKTSMSSNKNVNRILLLRRMIKMEQPDVVLSFLGPPNIRMLIATMGTKCRRVVSVRNDPYREYGKGIKKLFSNLIFHLADGVVFQTEEAANYFDRTVRRKSNVIMNPVDSKFFEHKWSGDGKKIVVVGRLQRQKNPMNVLCAYVSMHDSCPEYTLNYYGDGELRDEIRRYAILHGCESKVVFHGRSDNVEKVLENAAAFVLGSDYEGMPNALMEAMAVGVPSISTDCPCGGPRSLKGEEESCILVPCGDVDALAEALKMILSNVDLRRKLSIAARQRAQSFRTETILHKWDQFLFG